ncbi:MAG: tetratricopeptide repeat protein [candidate division Zixibacteria bacterium]
MRNALATVVHLPLNVLKGAGPELSEIYQVGHTYPVFILTNSSGEIITRWTGYTTSQRFVGQLKQAMSDLTTIAQREAQFDASPTLGGAIGLAKFNTDIGQHLQAAKYYRRAQALATNARIDLRYDVFKSMANAVWKEQVAYDSIFRAADAVMTTPRKNGKNTAELAKLMCKLARKFENTKKLSGYIDTALAITGTSPDAKLKQTYSLLRSEKALLLYSDTTGALEIKKQDLGPGWDTDRNRFFDFARWCLERKINLAESEQFARKAVNMVKPGKYRARVYNTLAEICMARGKKDEAISIINLAIDHDPENPLYSNQLKKYEEEAGP